MTINTTTTTAREMPWTAQNQTRRLIKNLRLAQVQTLRTMHLTLGAFSLALALLTIHRIISDARRASAVQGHSKKPIFAFLPSIHPAETFPLVLVCSSALQQVIFVAVQATSLSSVLSEKCRGLAMITYPAIFIVGYVTLIFGIEMAIRAFRAERFAPRGRWNAAVCIGAVSFLLFLTWLPTVIWPMFNRCFGGLIWFTMRYETISISILSVLIFLCLLLAVLISIQLMRTSNLDPNERIAASRMCYYLLIAAIVYTLVMPVEVQAHRRDFMNTLATSRVAEVALFSSGILIAFVHLFLRVNASRMVIKPVGAGMPTKQKRPKIRFFGPSDLEMNISGPIGLDGRRESREELMDEKSRYALEDQDYLLRSEKLAPLSPGSLKPPSKWPLPPDSAQNIFPPSEETTDGQHKRTKSAYSLFPTRAEEVPRLPATVYSPPKSGKNNVSNLAVRGQSRRSSLADAKSVTDVNEAYHWLSAPAPLFGKRPHRREESTDSSATVQIGLRFSVAPAVIAAAQCTAVSRALSPPPALPPSLRRDNTDSSSESLGLPIQSPSTHSYSSSVGNISAIAFPEPPNSTATTSPSKSGPASYLQSARDKVLPPTPRYAKPGPPPPAAAPTPPKAVAVAVSGLRMNPVSPASPKKNKTPTTRSATTSPSSGARIPMGAGTMSRSPPPFGWI
ncbi:hypothetical protein GQ43DRAFT_447731 [Delitschia confertaspora ATCC 74209]|uniref:Uncharacterized protein n=1 Tax=Delitschia confertaspora ATCC 74209 TaxID=1513339 RepID=A0A9P4MUG1_9PLEO|nr:hypothetical protein GQ43DRAFT_447731 [Delitschia confertaspora ATCC 74209]